MARGGETTPFTVILLEVGEINTDFHHIPLILSGGRIVIIRFMQVFLFKYSPLLAEVINMPHSELL